MRERRWIIAGIVVLATLALSVGSSGYTATAGERSVTVDVVEDAEASLALSYARDRVAIEPNTEQTLVTVDNRLSRPVDVVVDTTVEESCGLAVAQPTSERHSLGPGAEFAVPIRVSCSGEQPGEGTATIRFDVRAEGEHIAFETGEPRAVTYAVKCPVRTASTDRPETTSADTNSPIPILDSVESIDDAVSGDVTRWSGGRRRSPRRMPLLGVP